MKRYAFLLLFFLCVCISCQKDSNVIGENGIQILSPSVSVTEGTKSSVVEHTLADQSSFGLFGYCVPFQQDGDKQLDWAAGSAPWISKKEFAYADVFFNQEVTVNKGGLCSYKPSQQWYSEDEEVINGVDKFKYTFFAYYPFKKEKGVQVVAPLEQESLDLPVVKYTVPFKGSDTSTPLNDELIEDFMYASSINTLKHEGKLALRFSHAMAGLKIKFKSYNKNKIVTIKKAELVCKDFFKNITLNFGEVENKNKFMEFDEEQKYSGTYNLLEDNKVVTLDLDESKDRIDYTSPKNILLITNVNADKNSFGASAELHVEMETKDKKTGQTSTINFNDFRLPDSFKAFPGIIYMLEVNLVDEDFVVNIIAKNSEIWEDGGDSDCDID